MTVWELTLTLARLGQTYRQTDRQTNGTDSIAWTTDAGGNDKGIKTCFNMTRLSCEATTDKQLLRTASQTVEELKQSQRTASIKSDHL